MIFSVITLENMEMYIPRSCHISWSLRLGVKRQLTQILSSWNVDTFTLDTISPNFLTNNYDINIQINVCSNFVLWIVSTVRHNNLNKKIITKILPLYTQHVLRKVQLFIFLKGGRKEPLRRHNSLLLSALITWLMMGCRTWHINISYWGDSSKHVTNVFTQHICVQLWDQPTWLQLAGSQCLTKHDLIWWDVFRHQTPFWPNTADTSFSL